jgi:hypothetical protein
MPQTPIEIMESAYESAKGKSTKAPFSVLPNECVRDLKIIVENAETQRAVLGVTLTSLVYKIFEPSQVLRQKAT